VSPVGGAPGRRLRGAPRARWIDVTCTCGTEYQILASALDDARCPSCKLETRALPVLSFASIFPTDPVLAKPVLTGLDEFAKQVGRSLDDQAAKVSRTRRQLLTFSVAGFAAAFLVPVALGATVLLGKANSDLTPLIVLAAMASGSAVVIGLVTFRVFQVSDETLRRLNEKRVSLAFLKSAVDLSASAAAATPVLERSFDMFLTHYESTYTPVTVTDVWPTFTRPPS
jgi:hypothetical protein